jgi:hypothetical protein
MSLIFTSINKEVIPKVMYEGSEDYEGLIICKCKEKTIINRNNAHLYLDLISFAHDLGLKEKELLEIISYSMFKTYLAYYRDKNLKVVRLLEIIGLDDLTRLLRSVGKDSKKLKETKDKVIKMIDRIEEKEGLENGKN